MPGTQLVLTRLPLSTACVHEFLADLRVLKRILCDVFIQSSVWDGDWGNGYGVGVECVLGVQRASCHISPSQSAQHICSEQTFLSNSVF